MNNTTRTNAQQSGRVVVNAEFSGSDMTKRKTIDLAANSNFKRLYEGAILDDSYLSILPGEPLLMYKANAPSALNKKRKFRDTTLQVFSSLNGLLRKNNETAADVEKTLQFAGFADIAASYDSQHVRDEDAVVQLGGVRSIINTGNQNIHLGDWLYWKLPDKFDYKNKKIVAEIHPLKFDHLYSNAAIVKKLREMKLDFDPAEKKSEYIQKLLKEYNSMFVEMTHKIVGKALSSAAPGGQLDVVLGRYAL